MDKNNKGMQCYLRIITVALLLFTGQIITTKVFAQTTYEIFITRGSVNAVPGITVYHIKQGDNLLTTINQQLKHDGVMDEQTAATYVTQLLQDLLINQMTGLTKAAQYQLKYFPAIVKNGQFVIYGTTNPKAFDGIAH